jgi:hypothetical protein
MRSKLFAIPLLFLSMVAWLAVSSGAAQAKDQFLPNATVKSVSGTSLTVTANGKDTTFSVDAKTRVVGKGIGTKSKAKGGKPTIVDLLKEGDRVTVTYHEMGATMQASKIDVTAAGPTR